MARLVARREIETWIHFLGGSPVDEHTEYPKLTGREADAAPAARMFGAHAVSRTVPRGAPPSMTTALGELDPFV